MGQSPEFRSDVCRDVCVGGGGREGRGLGNYLMYLTFVLNLPRVYGCFTLYGF